MRSIKNTSVALVLALGVLSPHAAVHAQGGQVSPDEVEGAVVATWSGGWSNDVSGDNGEVTIRVARASGGTIEGTGESAGKRCKRSFDVSGWYRDSLVQLDLTLPDAGEGCPAAQVNISLRVGKKGDQQIAIGHWSNTIDGRSAGRAFGIVQLVRQ